MKLTEATVRQLATGQSFSRGQEYYEDGFVLSLVQRGNTLYGEVQGSQYEPYEVTITLQDDRIEATYCTCPYDWGGICKHSVAVLLSAVHDAETVEERPAAEALLAGLDETQLRSLLLKVIELRPDIIDFVESHVLPQQTEPTARAPLASTSTALNPAPFRRRAQAIIHSLDRMRRSEAYWHVGSVVSQLGDLVDEAQAYIDAGDGGNALVILEALTDVYVDEWHVLDDSSGEVGGFFAKLGQPWAEALLSVDLAATERESWIERLTEWQEELGDYGLDDIFDAALAAVVQGWDSPPLQGEEPELGAWDGKTPWFAEELARARLSVLARQERYDDYLRLAQAEGQVELYATMLVQLGRIEEAVAYGLNEIGTASTALALARSLHAEGEIDAALRVAERGLDLRHEQATKVILARWLRDTARDAGQSELALRAGLVAFHEQPDLADYQAIESLAGNRWPELRLELLEHVRRLPSFFGQGKVDVLLHEGLVEDAIKVVDDQEYPYYGLVERVVDAAIESHPQWVIGACRYQAESLMNRGQSKYYDHAVRWLNKARAAYLAAGQPGDWQAYLDGLLAKHGRKYSLVPKLKAIR